MKLCFLANAASIHTKRWATHFSQRGHEVTVVSLTGGQIPGVAVRCIGPDPERMGLSAYLAGLPGTRRALREIRPDLVHTHYIGGYGLLAALTGYHPMVMTAWGSDVLVVPRRSRVLGEVMRWSLRRADLVTSMALHMTAQLGTMGVVCDNLLTLPFGADTSVFHPTRRKAKDGTRFPLIVSTRTLELVYNVGSLIDALPSVLAQFPDAKLAIIGDGSERQALESRARKLDVFGHVTFRGRATPAEVAEALSDADVFVSTSLSDGNNISLNEAMACGAFPVVTDIPANREWVQHGRNGLFAIPNDPVALAEMIVLALRSADLRRAAAAVNWRIVQERASWGTAMNTMEDHYKRLIE